jgi:hypothetical protein
VLESFYLRKNAAEVERRWEEKKTRARAVLGREPRRELRPHAVGDRSRVDLMWRRSVGQRGGLGLRGPTLPSGGFEFHDLFSGTERPDSPSAGVLEAAEALLADPPPLDLAQLRFREGLHGRLGLWIDTANEAIKALLDEGSWLERRAAAGWTVEMGQKGKEAVRDEAAGRWALATASPKAWLASYDVDNRPIPLLSSVASFSQPGPETNRALLVAGFELLAEAGLGEIPWREWGAGYGNLTAAYATLLGPEGEASELDPAAAELLERNRRTFFPKIAVKREAAEKSVLEGDRSQLWLIDPPRPGFGALLSKLEGASRRPRSVLAYHCHENGLANDSAILRKAGYALVDASLVDAFPATPHLEVITLWQLP